MGVVNRWSAVLFAAFMCILAACSKPEPPEQKDVAAPVTAAPMARIVVAVLPMGAQGDEVVDGFTLHFARKLAQIPGVASISPESSFRFRDSAELNSVIGEQLGATHVLRGRLLRRDGRLTLDAELVQASGATTLWQQHFERTEKEIFALQDEVFAAVVKAFGVSGKREGGQDDRPPGKSFAAYEAMLDGLAQLQGTDVFSAQAALESLQQALSIEPQYAYASAQLAMARMQQLQRFPALYAEQRANEQRLAKQNAEAALQWAPQLPEAHLAMANWWLEFGNSPQQAMVEIQQALKLRPSDAQLLMALAVRQISFDQLQAAVETLRQALKYNPLSAPTYYTLGSVYLGLADYEQAEHEFLQSLKLAPQMPLAHAFLAMAVFQQGRNAEAIKLAQQEPAALWRHYSLAMAYWAEGARAQSENELQALIQQHAGEAATQIAGVYAQRDDEAAMFKWLDVARQARDPGLMEIRYMPYISRYSNDPRFTAILRELGFTAQASK